MCVCVHECVPNGKHAIMQRRRLLCHIERQRDRRTRNTQHKAQRPLSTMTRSGGANADADANANDNSAR